mgnify:FL=1
MNMNNGLYLAHKTDDGVRAVHIDEEVLWFAKLNRHTRSRREAAGKALSIRCKNAARYRRDFRAACKGAAAKAVLAAGLMAATAAGWIVPGLGLPAAVVLLCAASAQVGHFLGKRKSRPRG